MSINSLKIEVASIETQLKVLKANLNKNIEAVKEEKKKPSKFSDFYGIWKNKVNLSYEEIKTAKFKVAEDLLK